MSKLISLDEQIKVMSASGAGKRIEYRSKPGTNLVVNKWVVCPYPIWNWAHFEYRIKTPPPAIIWRNKYSTSGISAPHITASDANSSVNHNRNRTHLTKEIHYPIVSGIVVGLEDDCD